MKKKKQETEPTTSLENRILQLLKSKIGVTNKEIIEKLKEEGHTSLEISLAVSKLLKKKHLTPIEDKIYHTTRLQETKENILNIVKGLESRPEYKVKCLGEVFYYKTIPEQAIIAEAQARHDYKPTLTCEILNILLRQGEVIRPRTDRYQTPTYPNISVESPMKPPSHAETFIEETRGQLIEFDKTSEIPGTDIYNEYVSWCEGEGEDPLQRNRFYHELKYLKGIEKTWKNNRVHFKGIKIVKWGPHTPQREPETIREARWRKEARDTVYKIIREHTRPPAKDGIPEDTLIAYSLARGLPEPRIRDALQKLQETGNIKEENNTYKILAKTSTE